MTESNIVPLPVEDAALERLAVEIDKVREGAYMEVAKLLKEAQERFRYRQDDGGFQGWVTERCGISRRTAYRMLEVYEQLGSVCHRGTLSEPSIKKLGSSRTPKEVREKVRDGIEAGKTYTEEEIERLRTEARQQGLVDATRTIAEQEREQYEADLQRVKDAARKELRAEYDNKFAERIRETEAVRPLAGDWELRAIRVVLAWEELNAAIQETTPKGVTGGMRQLCRNQGVDYRERMDLFHRNAYASEQFIGGVLYDLMDEFDRPVVKKK